MATHTSEIEVVRGACPQDCPDTCAFLYHVEDGRLVEVTGDPDHPGALKDAGHPDYQKMNQTLSKGAPQ